MLESNEALVSAMERDQGSLAIVFCPNLRLREQLADEVESLAPTAARPLRTSDVRAAIAAHDRLVLLIPDDEREVVLDLDGSREQTFEPPRTQPIVLFLIRDGDGCATLATDAPSIRSWASGSDVDPERLAEIDVDAERDTFYTRTGQTPEAWLDQWRSGAIPQDAATYTLAYRAALLERQS
jgi:hypothetical protein